ncbi:MAG: acyl dehydratase [Alphaproteobacteria bacterium]|nr:acyl dehydratase [Alphaproteobacteria bacterium]
METIGLGFFFEDMPEGRQFRTLGRSVTEADIANFLGATGITEVLFTNLDYLANHTDFDGRLVPGALVFAVAEGLVMSASIQETGVAFLGMELDIKGPVFAGDTLYVECEVIEARRTSKRPDRALVRTRNTVVNQDGKTVMVYTPLRMMKCRDKG